MANILIQKLQQISAQVNNNASQEASTRLLSHTSNSNQTVPVVINAIKGGEITLTNRLNQQRFTIPVSTLVSTNSQSEEIVNSASLNNIQINKQYNAVIPKGTHSQLLLFDANTSNKLIQSLPLSTLSQTQLETLVKTLVSKPSSLPISLQPLPLFAKVIEQSSSSLTIAVGANKDSINTTLTLPVISSSSLNAGDQLSITLHVKDNNWLISFSNGKEPLARSLSSSIIPDTTHSFTPSALTKQLNQHINSQLSSNQIVQLAAEAVTSKLTGSLQAHIIANLSGDSATSILPATISSKLSAEDKTNALFDVVLKAPKGGVATNGVSSTVDIAVLAKKPLLSFSLNNQQFNVTSNKLGLVSSTPVIGTSSPKDVSISPVYTARKLISDSLQSGSLNQKLTNASDLSRVQNAVSPVNQSDIKDRQKVASVLDPINTMEKSVAADTTARQPTAELLSKVVNLLKLKPEDAINQLQIIAKQLLIKTESPNEVLQRILLALDDKTIIYDPATKELASKLSAQLSSSNNVHNANELAESIKSVAHSPFTALPANSLLNLQKNSHFMSGLATLVQIALLGRMHKEHTKPDRVQQAATELLKSVMPNITAPQTAKILLDIHSLEQRHQLLREVNKLMSSHKHSKLSGAESSLQGQDTFYYALPTLTQNSKGPVELLIKREKGSNNKEENDLDKHQWNVTMKLNVGKQGDVLAKTVLFNNTIELALFVSNDDLKSKVFDLLPYLEKRLTSLGITVTSKKCQLGKIPTTLNQQHYHAFQTSV